MYLAKYSQLIAELINVLNATAVPPNLSFKLVGLPPSLISFNEAPNANFAKCSLKLNLVSLVCFCEYGMYEVKNWYGLVVGLFSLIKLAP